MINVNKSVLALYKYQRDLNSGQSNLQPYHPCGNSGPRPLNPLTGHTPRQPTIYAMPDSLELGPAEWANILKSYVSVMTLHG